VKSSGNVQLRIFDDRIEVRNPGGLPQGLTVDDLRKDHDSFPRNRLIADCFFFVKLIERWGTGTNRMIDLCVNHGLPEPEFEDKKISFVVRFNKFFITEDILGQLNDRQKEVIEFLKENKRVTTSEYAKMFGITDRTARRDMNQMIDLGLIEKIGDSDKTTCYILSGHLADI
jgi:ATP-dependent DNA helicase RecG